jgi:hypothetical protein
MEPRLLQIVKARGLDSQLSKPVLMQLGTEMAKHYNLRIDRLAIRYRSIMICWFCEIWERFNILPLEADPDTEIYFADAGFLDSEFW